MDLDMAGIEMSESDAMVPRIWLAPRISDLEFWRQYLGGLNLPDSHAAPVKPTILAVVNAVVIL